MPYKRSQPQETLARIQAEIDLALPGADARLRFSVEQVLARMLAMASYEMDGYIEYVMQQILPTTCDEAHLPLHGRLWGVSQLTARYATGAVTFTGADGAVIVQGTVLRAASGQEYAVNADATISSGTATAAVTALVAGENANLPAFASVSLITPLAGVDGTVKADAQGITGGVDVEDLESWRGRILRRIQQPPHGGNQADYESWAKEVAGVSRVWVYPGQLGLGTVYLLFVMDEKSGTILPSATEVQDVQDHIDVLRPVTADVTVAAPMAVAVDFTIQLAPNTVAVQQAVMAELEDLIRRESTPGGTLLISHVREAISIAAGETDHALTAPMSDIPRGFAEITVLGNVTFEAIA